MTAADCSSEATLIKHLSHGSHSTGLPCGDITVKMSRTSEHVTHVFHSIGLPCGDITVKMSRLIKHAVHGCHG